MRKCLFFGIMGLILSFQTAKADVWTVRQSWSPAKELEYQSWIQRFAQVDMFSNPKRTDGSPNPYYGITTDCADTIYSLETDPLNFTWPQSIPNDLVTHASSRI